MSTFANRHNNSAPMSESDNDDDNEQNPSFNQQNESMMHKVKDVVSKLLHPSFLFSASGDTTRSKRKRTISIEHNDDEKQQQQPETSTTSTHPTTTNGHSTTSKSKDHRRPITDDEPQLTDDEDNNGRDVSPIEQNPTEIEQQKKRRRTANYQHIIKTTTTNGNHEDERISPPFTTSTNSVGSLSNRRIIDNGLNTANTTPVLLQTSTEQNHNEGINRSTLSKQRFNIPSMNRGLTPTYDPSQSPLFSVGARKTMETTMSPNRTTTNLKSNANEFTANYLLATGLVNRFQPTTPTQNTQQSSSTLTNRLLSNERQMFGVNYASINSRRLPYIERLRRRTLQDCIRLNRTLDSEPLSISTIEEHTSTTSSPIRKPIKAPEKECGIQCNITTTDSSMEPSKKIQRTFPPADIRNEALCVPITTDRVQSTNQSESSIQTNSSITIEPMKSTNDITKPKVLGTITPFSWPKFARAQEDYAKKYPEKCRGDALPTQPPRSTISSVIEKPIVNTIPSVISQTNVSSTMSKVPIFGVSPPRSTKSIAGPIWICPSCTMEHPAQTASCSLCRGINPNYKRLSAMESTPLSLASSTKPHDVIIEEPIVSMPVTTTQTTFQITPIPIITSPPVTTTKESTFSIPPPVTTAAPLTTISSLPLFGTTPPVTTTVPLFNATPFVTKENSISNPPVITSTPFPSTTTPLFGTSTATLDKSATTIANNPFQSGINTTATFPSFGSANTTTATSTSSTPSFITTTTTSSSPIKVSTSMTFGSFGSTPITTTVTPIPSTILSDKPPSFSFGASAPSLSLGSSSTTIAATTTTSITPNLFAFSSNVTAPTTTTSASLTLPVSTTTTTISGFSFPGGFPSASTSSIATTANTSAASLFSSGLSSSSSGFSFPSGGITTTSSSTPFAFGAGSPLKPFAPPVISTNTTIPTPAFGANASFGGVPSTVDKPLTSVPSFSAFGSTANTPSSFSFGGTSNTTTNPIQTSVSTAGTTSGFPFTAPSTAAGTAPTFGSAPSTFAFSGASSFSFGSSSAAPTSNAPFQFSAAPTPTVNNAFSSGFPATPSPIPENNPFSVGGEDPNRRPVIKAKRRAKQ